MAMAIYLVLCVWLLLWAAAWVSEYVRLHPESVQAPLPAREREGGWIAAIGLAISVGLSIYSGYLLRKKLAKLQKGDGPPTLTLRGAYTCYSLGINQPAVIFAWAGGRRTAKERAKNGKKGSVFASLAPKQTIYREDGWHIIGTGDLEALEEIKQNGEVIFTGPITPDSHPSGTTIDVGNEGSFRMFWGQEDQPVNTFLGDSTRVGVESAWPWVPYLEWRQKRLSTAPNWPDLVYTTRTAPNLTACALVGLTGDGYFEPTRTLDGQVNDIFDHLNGVSGVGKFVFIGDLSPQYHSTFKVRLTGNAHADADFTILRATKVEVEIEAAIPPTEDDPGRPAKYQTRTEVYFFETLAGANDAGELQLYSQAKDDGYNPAHLLAHALFAEKPKGLGRKVRYYDIESFQELEALAIAANNGNGLRCRMYANNGTTFDRLIGALLTDLGVMLPVDQNTGLLRLVPQRRADLDDVPMIGANSIVSNGIEIEQILRRRWADEVVYTFQNRERDFSEDGVLYSNDGQFQGHGNHQNSRTVSIESTTHFDTALEMSKWRSNEDLSTNSGIGYDVKGLARTLYPGSVVQVEGLPTLQRLMTVKPNSKTDRVRLEGLADNYGCQLTDQAIDPFGGSGGSAPSEVDLHVALLEVPEAVPEYDGKPTIVVLRVRAHSAIRGAAIYMSMDNSTYDFAGSDDPGVPGGELIDELPASAYHFMELGPTFTALGPDIANVLDLSGNPSAWRSGQQLCLINNELFFLRNITSLGGDVYRLEGLIRARYDTRRATHEAGTKFVIFMRDDGFAIQDVRILPETTVWVKASPFSSNALPISGLAPTGINPYGKGIRPVTPGKPRTTVHRAGYLTGEDITFVWSYSTPRTKNVGAGGFPAGSAVETIPPEGDFVVQILNDMDVEMNAYIAPGAEFEYTNAALISDFGSQPDSYQVRVFQRRLGYTSFSSRGLVMEKLS